jgi:hypothetical protein
MECCKFSETQFSFCFTFEFIKRYLPAVPLPIFPNTVVEGREFGGYDVRIDGNIYFQYKVPKFYDRRSNFRRRQWNVFNEAYYKVEVDTDGQQFRLLKDLIFGANEAYYCTPEFHLIPELEIFYLTDEIQTNSALFSIQELPNYGSGFHELIYNGTQNWGMLFSDPQTIKKTKKRNLLDSFAVNKSEETIYSEAVRIESLIRERGFEISKRMGLNSDSPVRLVKEVYTILLSEFNVHWYPVVSVGNLESQLNHDPNRQT